MRGLLAIAASLALVACGSRTQLLDAAASATGSGGAGTGGGGVGAGGSGGAPPCDPPPTATLLAAELGAARALEVYGDSVYLLTVNDLWRIPACGQPKLLAKNSQGEGSVDGLSVSLSGAWWGASGQGASLAHVTLDGNFAKFQSVSSVLAVTADQDGVYYLRQDGSLIANHTTLGTITLASGSPVGYWSSLGVSQGFVYGMWGTSSPGGPLVRARTDGTGVQTFSGGPIPEGLAVDGSEVFMALAHGVDQIQIFATEAQEITVLASDQPTPTRVKVDGADVYFVTDDGVRFVSRSGGEVTVFHAQEGVRELAVGPGAVYWATDGGDVFWQRR